MIEKEERGEEKAREKREMYIYVYMTCNENPTNILIGYIA